jgi:hypothetical protein
MGRYRRAWRPNETIRCALADLRAGGNHDRPAKGNDGGRIKTHVIRIAFHHHNRPTPQESLRRWYTTDGSSLVGLEGRFSGPAVAGTLVTHPRTSIASAPAGHPDHHQVIVQLIASTKTETGLNIICDIDWGRYPKGIKVSNAALISNTVVARNSHHTATGFIRLGQQRCLLSLRPLPPAFNLRNDLALVH